MFDAGTAATNWTLWRSQFFPPFAPPRMVHPEEGGGQSAHVSLALHKGGKGRDAVANEVVGSTQQVQVHLGRVGPETHHLHLRGRSHTQRLFTTLGR